MPEREGRSYQGCPEIFCDDLRTSLISRRKDKLNTYIWYIDSKQYKEKYSNVKSVELRVSFLFAEPEICRKLLERAKQVFVDVFENVEMIVEHGTK